VAFAEIHEVRDLVSAAEPAILLRDSATQKPLSYAPGTAARYDSDRVAVHCSHPYREAVLRVEGAVEFAFKVAKYAAVREDAVYIEGEGLYLGEVNVAPWHQLFFPFPK
jgi:hypothetical protein